MDKKNKIKIMKNKNKNYEKLKLRFVCFSITRCTMEWVRMRSVELDQYLLKILIFSLHLSVRYLMLLLQLCYLVNYLDFSFRKRIRIRHIFQQLFMLNTTRKIKRCPIKIHFLWLSVPCIL